MKIVFYGNKILWKLFFSICKSFVGTPKIKKIETVVVVKMSD